MKDILKYVIGFRTDTKWKKEIAIIYYLFCLLMLIVGVGAFLIMSSLPFILFGIIGIIKHNKDKVSISTLVIAIIICVIGANLDNSTPKTASASKEIVASEKVPEVKEKTAEEIKKEADEKAKVDAEAKAIADKKVIEDKKIADAQAVKDKETARLKAIEDKKAIADKKITNTQEITVLKQELTGSLGEGEVLKDIKINNSQITLEVSLGDEGILPLEDLAEARYSSLSDKLLLNEYWTNITVNFINVGSITMDTKDAVDEGLGKCFKTFELEKF